MTDGSRSELVTATHHRLEVGVAVAGRELEGLCGVSWGIADVLAVRSLVSHPGTIQLLLPPLAVVVAVEVVGDDGGIAEVAAGDGECAGVGVDVLQVDGIPGSVEFDPQLCRLNALESRRPTGALFVLPLTKPRGHVLPWRATRDEAEDLVDTGSGSTHRGSGLSLRGGGCWGSQRRRGSGGRGGGGDCDAKPPTMSAFGSMASGWARPECCWSCWLLASEHRVGVVRTQGVDASLSHTVIHSSWVVNQRELSSEYVVSNRANASVHR